jgi:hypothetical protein
MAGIFGAIFYFRGQGSQTTPEIVPDKVRVTNISDNKFSVSWVSKSPTKGAVEYGVVGESLTNKAKDERDTTTAGEYLTHHVVIEGLQPSTQYAFRILVGDKPVRFDSNGSPYTATTGPVIGATPASHNFYGNVVLPSKQNANGAIVYLTLPGGATSSTLVRETGNYAFTLSTMRTTDLRSYVVFDPSATIANVTVEAGNQQAVSSVSLANAAPVPTITLGQNADFLNTAQTPTVAQVKPGETINSVTETDNVATKSGSTTTETAETPSILNVEPLSGSEINAVTTGSVTLLNPKEPGETLKTLRPEFRGTGPAGTILSIALTGQKAISDTTEIESDGTWTWAPVIDLRAGKQTITLTYAGANGSAQKLSREFNVSTTTTTEPAFVASPSGTKASAKPSSTASASATPRAAMPATDSGVPVTGVIENTLLTGALGIVIMVLGAILLSL